MKRSYFSKLEPEARGTSLDLNAFLDQLAFNDQGLIPVITQDANTKEVLMHAWMNRESLELTIATKKMTYWSRSRNKLWVKGETSGHTQSLLNMAFDCDGDTVLCQVDQVGPACHTGRSDCFYFQLDGQNQTVRISSNADST